MMSRITSIDKADVAPFPVGIGNIYSEVLTSPSAISVRCLNLRLDGHLPLGRTDGPERAMHQRTGRLEVWGRYPKQH